MTPNEKANVMSETDVDDLQSRLAMAELMDRPHREDDRIELLVLQKEHTKVRLRRERNHARPHFHIEYKKEHSASYAIDNFEKLAGSMPRKYEQAILTWAKDKKASLLTTWNDLMAGKEVHEFVVEKEEP